MKTMRYRIRVIALVLVCSLLFVVLWTAKAAFFMAGEDPEKPSESPVISSSLPPDPWAAPTPDPAETAMSFPEGTEAPTEESPSSSPAPLFDTTGL